MTTPLSAIQDTGDSPGAAELSTGEAAADPIADHSYSLGNVFINANQRDGTNAELAEWARKFLPSELEVCRAMIASRTPCTLFENGVAMKFLERHDWARHPEIVELFRDYVAAGMLDVDGPLRNGNVFTGVGTPPNNLVLPLEFAIINDNLDAFRVFLEAGADLAKIPSRDWTQTSNTRAKSDGTPPADIYEVITAKVRNPALGPLMASVVTEVLMRKRIDATLDGHEMPAGPRARRAGRVL
ncbi:hypothetical protein [Paucibacter soli]|uniref:hypothetical protein n=1 Tax=Paucibacter soli TaxID=3133433 RepID=UPI003098767B